MSDGFDSRKDVPAVRKAQAAYIKALLEELLPPMRMTARGAGYAIAVHGSLSRDIDLIAVPWTLGAMHPLKLIDALVGTIASVTGRAALLGTVSVKPHGRLACTIIHGGHEGEIDLSVMSLKVED